MPSSITTNMSLIVPIVGQEPGPQYATDINSDLSIIDNHNHTPGFGVPVPTAGLSINADLPINNNRALLAKSVTFTSQGSPLSGISPDVGALYVSGVDLYYNDINGNQIRVTQNGNITGSAGSISGLVSPASASYSVGGAKFIWQSNVATSAGMDNGPVTIRENVANAKGITIQSPISLAADYSITLLPALPSATKTLTIDSSGNLGTSVIAASYQISSSCGSFTTTSGTATPITNLSITITTSGGPVMLMCQSDNSGANNYSGFGVTTSNTSVSVADINWFNGLTSVSATNMGIQNVTGGLNGGFYPGGIINCLDTSVAGIPGTYTYTVKAAVSNNATTFTATNLVITGYEI